MDKEKHLALIADKPNKEEINSKKNVISHVSKNIIDWNFSTEEWIKYLRLNVNDLVQIY